jgi:hypothetical protein
LGPRYAHHGLRLTGLAVHQAPRCHASYLLLEPIVTHLVAHRVT